MKISEALLKAVEYIEKCGWFQGDFSNDAARHDIWGTWDEEKQEWVRPWLDAGRPERCFPACALGACRAVLSGHPLRGHPGTESMAKLLSQVAPVDPDSYQGRRMWIAKYNDMPGRTKEEVLALFREAAALPEADEEL